jgi:hypothetical protein
MKRKIGAAPKIKEALLNHVFITKAWARQRKLKWDTVVKRISDIRKTIKVDGELDAKGNHFYFLAVKKSKQTSKPKKK